MKKFFYILCFIGIVTTNNSACATDTYPYDVANPIVLQTPDAKFATILYDHKLEEKTQAEKEAQIAKIKASIPKYKNQIFDAKSPGRVIFGNPKGKILIAEFTQHQCPHCQEAALVVNKLLKKFSDVQVIVIYWPFFGNDAVYTAKAVLAANKQNQAQALDLAFFSHKEFITKNKAQTIIQSTSKIIDNKKLAIDINTKEFDQGLRANIQLAGKLNLTGTPVFIFTNQDMTKFGLVPGHTINFEADLIKAIKDVG